MSNDNMELVNSFKLGANKEKDRDPKDLGRFGFGMKTASLSQSRSLTVITKKKGKPKLNCPSIAKREIKEIHIANTVNSIPGEKLNFLLV